MFPETDWWVGANICWFHSCQPRTDSSESQRWAVHSQLHWGYWQHL